MRCASQVDCQESKRDRKASIELLQRSCAEIFEKRLNQASRFLDFGFFERVSSA
jgi:hypothetical protein